MSYRNQGSQFGRRILRRFHVVVLFAAVALLAGCNSGGSSPITSSSSPPASSAVTYTSVAGVGELLTYKLNTTNLKYSYTITRSGYGLQGTSGSGTLTANSDGTYTPVGMPNVRIIPSPNGMLVGAVKLPINGTSRIVPIVGFEYLQTGLNAIQGTYNGVQLDCRDSTQADCETAYGTIHLDANGTWVSCSGADYTVDLNCSGHTKESGTLNYLGGGLWQVMRANGAQDGTLLVFRAPNGQNVFLEDSSTPVSAGGTGVGMTIGSTLVSNNQTVAQGAWNYAGETMTGGYAGSFTVSGNSYSGSMLGGASYGPLSLTFNTPWAGFATSTNGAVALLAGTGVYVAITRSSIEFGLKH